MAERYVSTYGCVACGVAIAEEAKTARQLKRAAKPLSPRQLAKVVGAKQYVCAKPCFRCNTYRRSTINGACVHCSAAKMRERYQEDAEFRDKHAAYRKRESETVKAYVRKRRAMKHSAEGSHNTDDIADLFDEQEGRCPYCDVFLRSCHVGHKTPLTRGGANSKDNLQLTCATCNTRKHTKTDEEFKAVLARSFAVAKS